MKTHRVSPQELGLTQLQLYNSIKKRRPFGNPERVSFYNGECIIWTVIP